MSPLWQICDSDPGAQSVTALSASLAAYSHYWLSLCSRKTEERKKEKEVGTEMEVKRED